MQKAYFCEGCILGLQNAVVFHAEIQNVLATLKYIQSFIQSSRKFNNMILSWCQISEANAAKVAIIISDMTFHLKMLIYISTN